MVRNNMVYIFYLFTYFNEIMKNFSKCESNFDDNIFQIFFTLKIIIQKKIDKIKIDFFNKFFYVKFYTMKKL